MLKTIFSCLRKLLCHFYSHLNEPRTWTRCSANCIILYFLLETGSQEISCLKKLKRSAFLSQSGEITSRVGGLCSIPSHFNTVKLKGGKFRTEQKEIHVKAEPAGLTV